MNILRIENNEIEIKCLSCDTIYFKPLKFKQYYDDRPNVFYKWSLTYCDPCRRDKERAALKSLPEVLDILSKSRN
jgi:hypothetical protein